ncbi:UDP-N-acetylmuramoyl-L-alanyl-D-glutamate--2,6-diaminopimelate ligase [Thermohalobacter berrensis]|uniref:UDP-N-acetylmuramyl-tripeptide synthetase n=1 Tax=Thermohalobacter berrensis TaxID=99594 RepID=A0A419TA05_9FIRM|nr:UDP-N-acetylmuramoyl-L-alanyl-D-glutamate--2,6-diaminopimelate ligase [Thermohalobacter berrensis]RKD34295.1 UDP-N-acetylmuramoyl-L-alanyl-D-glutamate--2,6-diaminopimelate ligase [Thermohalobacter berrensis]
MKLKTIVNNLHNIVNIEGNLDINIDNIVYDSRKATENSIFVAIEGFKVDGHKFIADAVDKGAKAVVVEKKVNVKDDVSVIRVNNSRVALAQLSSIFFKNPSEKLDLIGITGTNGKTTTTYLIKSIFEAADRKIGLIGTMGSIVGNEINKTNNTTPESLDLQRSFRKMVDKGLDSCVMEISSHSLELNRVDFSDVNVGIFTNLSEDHLDFHKTLEDYFEAKLKLFYKTKDYNIVNSDDKYGKKIIEKIKELDTPVLTYGIDSKADIKATDIEYNNNGVRYLLNTPKGSIKIELNIPGKFSVYNSLAAAACGYAYNISLETIKKALERVKGVKGRFELVPNNRDISIIIDYAHTPDGFKKVLNTIEQFAEGRKIIVFGCGGDRDRTKRPKMGEIAARYCDLSILTTDNARSEDPADIVEDILVGVKKVNGNYKIILDRREAIKYAIENSKPKDVILVAGKGHETYQIIGDNIYLFDERKIILEILDEIK